MQRSPEAQLEFFDWGIRLQRMHFKLLGDCFEIRYNELTEARQAGKMIRRCVRFHTDVLPYLLTFVSVEYLEILEQLERRGVPVNRNAAPLIVQSWRPTALLRHGGGF